VGVAANKGTRAYHRGAGVGGIRRVWVEEGGLPSPPFCN